MYVFWWTGSISDFVNDGVNRVIRFKGPNGRPVDVEFSDDWIERIQIDGKIPLYVGKTADSLQKRISLHLQLKTKRGLSLGGCCFSRNGSKTRMKKDLWVAQVFMTMFRSYPQDKPVLRLEVAADMDSLRFGNFQLNERQLTCWGC